MATLDERFEAAATKAENASEIGREWANGDATTTITTESGPLPSLAKFLDTNQTSIDNFVNNNQTTLDRVNAMQKLVDNAVVYLNFTEDEGFQHNDLSVTRNNATGLINYTCATTATGQTADGRIVEVAANTPRLVWNNGKAVGLLNEPSGESLSIWPEKFDETAWVKEDTTTATGGTINFSASLTFNNLGTSGERVRQSVILTAGERLSCFFAIPPSSEWSDPTARLHIGFFSNVAAQIVEAKNEWQYIQLTGLDNGDGNVVLAMKADKNVTITGIKAQLQRGYPTSYIPTTNSPTVRGKTLTAKDITINAGRGTLFFEGVINESSVPAFSILDMGDTSIFQDSISIRSNGQGSVDFFSASGGVINIATGGTQVVLGERHKIACVFFGTTMKGFIDGVKVFENTVDFKSPETVSKVSILKRFDGSSPHNGVCSKAVISASDMTDAEASALTAL